MTELLLGADVGGSSTRVAVATADEGIVEVAVGGPGNPNVVGPDASARVIRSTADRVLTSVPGAVAAAVIGLAGGFRVASDPAFLAAALPERVTGPRLVVSDLAVAFSSATPAWAGCTLVAGTGAVAARVVGETLQDRRDGWGWLLGDGGSGFWLGREAVRATLRALEQERPLTGLSKAVLADAGVSDQLGLLAACYGEQPTWLTRFAPLVSRWADDDPAAGAIADEAAALLAADLAGLSPQADEPVVLGGSVLGPSGLATPGPIRRRLTDRLSFRLRLLQVESGLVGATWIAARRLGWDRPDLHARLRTSIATAARR